MRDSSLIKAMAKVIRDAEWSGGNEEVEQCCPSCGAPWFATIENMKEPSHATGCELYLIIVELDARESEQSVAAKDGERRKIEVRLDLGSGPKVFAPLSEMRSSVEAALPPGWRVKEWSEGLTALSDGRFGYPLERTGDTY